jgi:hypothetical protein
VTLKDDTSKFYLLAGKFHRRSPALQKEKRSGFPKRFSRIAFCEESLLSCIGRFISRFVHSLFRFVIGLLTAVLDSVASLFGALLDCFAPSWANASEAAMATENNNTEIFFTGYPLLVV